MVGDPGVREGDTKAPYVVNFLGTVPLDSGVKEYHINIRTLEWLRD